MKNCQRVVVDLKLQEVAFFFHACPYACLYKLIWKDYQKSKLRPSVT